LDAFSNLNGVSAKEVLEGPLGGLGLEVLIGGSCKVSYKLILQRKIKKEASKNEQEVERLAAVH